jgi:hypothetical protein
MGTDWSEHTQGRDSGPAVLGYFLDEIPSGDLVRAHFPFSFGRLGLKWAGVPLEPDRSNSPLSIAKLTPFREGLFDGTSHCGSPMRIKDKLLILWGIERKQFSPLVKFVNDFFSICLVENLKT